MKWRSFNCCVFVAVAMSFSPMLSYSLVNFTNGYTKPVQVGFRVNNYVDSWTTVPENTTHTFKCGQPGDFTNQSFYFVVIKVDGQKKTYPVQVICDSTPVYNYSINKDGKLGV